MGGRKQQSGMVLILSMVVVLAFSIIGLSLAQTISAQYASYKQRLYVENAVSAAEAGISATLAQLNKDSTFGGFATEQVLYSDNTRGRATYTVTVTTDANLNKILVSTGKTYKLQGDTVAVNTKQIRAVGALKRNKIANSVIIGSGGMQMMQNSKINKGNVYVRGQMTMDSGTSVGTASTPVMMNVANVGCGTTGAGSNWPQPCGASSPPIKMSGTGGTIYGTVCATNQVSSTGIIGTLTPGCVSDVTAAPTFNKKAFVQAINNSGGSVIDASTQSCGWGGNFTIPANTKFVGDLNLSSIGTCTITIEGDVYITGMLKVADNVTLRVSDNLGTTRPTIVTNKGVNFPVSTAKILANSFGTPMFLLDFGSIDTACSTSEIVPSDTQQTCLTNDEARTSAAVGGWTQSPGSGTIDFSGLILYDYYGSFTILSTNVVWAFYAFGAQGMGVSSGATLSTVSDDAPFGDLLYIPKYQLIQYKQL
jgi:Tfp pilus assembly protein PilX